jgi:DNA-binding ferritin-like protein
MSISIQEHIDDFNEKIAALDERYAALKARIDELKPVREEMEKIAFEKHDLEAVLINLQYIRNKEPDKQAVLNPPDPFGDAAS